MHRRQNIPLMQTFKVTLVLFTAFIIFGGFLHSTLLNNIFTVLYCKMFYCFKHNLSAFYTQKINLTLFSTFVARFFIVSHTIKDSAAQLL